jgi:predicted porin
MKKTIVAAAVAAVIAAPAAFADVKISGQITAEYKDASGADAELVEASDIVISGSEDLGNGMKVSFKLAGSPDSMTAGQASAGGAIGEDDRYISLSGDFGTVQFGRYEQLISAKGSDIANSLASSEVISIEEKTGLGQRGNQGVRYTSPNFNGVTVAAGGFMDGFDGDTAGADDFDVTEMMVSYSNAGLTVSFTSENNDIDSLDTDVIAAKYTMGDLTVAMTDLDSSTDANDATIVAAKYTMGNNSIAGAYMASHGTAANEGDFTLKATHMMSKSTSVWVGVESDDSASTNDFVSVGVKHAF